MLFTQAFSETESDIRKMVMVASIIMAIVMGAIACITVRLARSLSKGLTNPVNQLVDIVRGLNNLDFSRQVRWDSWVALLLASAFCNSRTSFQTAVHVMMMLSLFVP